MKAYEVVREWAEQNHVRFVSRTPGQCTTDTVSKAALEELVSAATEPLLERIAALEAKLAQRVPDDGVDEGAFLERFKENLRNLPAMLSAAPAAPGQQEPPPVTQPVHRATMACVECGGVLGHTRMCSKFTGYGGEVAQAPNAQLVPDGWKLVPIDPTELMLGAGLQHVDGMASMPAAYRAMLSAAPAAPEQQEPKHCPLCSSDEPFSGACGGGRNNPSALCYQAPNAQQAKNNTTLS